jgi:hypothetical protein
LRAASEASARGASLAFFCVKASVQPLIFAQLKIHN